VKYYLHMEHHSKKWITGLLLICVATSLTGCSAKETSGINVRYAMKAPGIFDYFNSPEGFFEMYQTAPVIMVIQPTTPLNQRENHSSKGSSQTYLLTSCRVTDVIANRSGEVVNMGEQVNIAERMYFESSERQRDIYETGDIKPNTVYPLDTLMIQDFYFFPLGEGIRYLVFCDVNHFGGEDGPVTFWPKFYGVMDLSSIEVTDSEMFFKTSSGIPGLAREGESEKNTLGISYILNDLGQMKVVAAQLPDLASLFGKR
jgi:hypothetical protein